MLEEKDFKKRLINKLNLKSKGWIEGDKENIPGKKVDIVNHRLKIAIEIKDDKKYKMPNGAFATQQTNLDIVAKRFADDVRSANNKFKNHPDYKTILLWRTQVEPQVAKRVIIKGIPAIDLTTFEKFYKRKYSNFVFKHIGCFLIFSYSRNEAIYLKNPLGDSSRQLTKEEVEDYLNMEFKEI